MSYLSIVALVLCVYLIRVVCKRLDGKLTRRRELSCLRIGLELELDKLRRERVELLSRIDNCYYHISLNEPYISDPMTGVLWMNYSYLGKLEREIALKESELRSMR